MGGLVFAGRLDQRSRHQGRFENHCPVQGETEMGATRTKKIGRSGYRENCFFLFRCHQRKDGLDRFGEQAQQIPPMLKIGQEKAETLLGYCQFNSHSLGRQERRQGCKKLRKWVPVCLCRSINAHLKTGCAQSVRIGLFNTTSECKRPEQDEFEPFYRKVTCQRVAVIG